MPVWGAEGAATALKRCLDTGLPTKLDELRTRYGVNDVDLPDIKIVHPTIVPLESMTLFPVVMIDVEDTNPVQGVRQAGNPGDLDVWTVPYRCRLYTYAMASNTQEVWLLTARLGLAVRELVLASRVITDDHGTGLIQTSTLKEQFYEVAGNTAASEYIQGMSVFIQVDAEETIPAPGAWGPEPVHVTHTEHVVGPAGRLQ